MPLPNANAKPESHAAALDAGLLLSVSIAINLIDRQVVNNLGPTLRATCTGRPRSFLLLQ